MRPICAAFSAGTMSPVSSISIAALRGTLRDSATIGVEQNRPMSTPGVANLAADGGDRQIAGRHQLAAGGGGGALHRGDHRLRQVDDLLHHGAARRHDVREIGAAAVGVAAPRGQFLHVVAGAEGRAHWPPAPRRGCSCRRRCRARPSASAASSASDRLLRAAGRLSVSTAIVAVALAQQHGRGGLGAQARSVSMLMGGDT